MFRSYDHLNLTLIEDVWHYVLTADHAKVTNSVREREIALLYTVAWFLFAAMCQKN
jgi:hypothetical protein